MASAKTAMAGGRTGVVGDSGPSDGELIGRFNARLDETAEVAFEQLIRRHGPMVLRICNQILADRHGAEDAFQATFLILARKSATIRRPESLASWLYGVALRTAREAKMREVRRRRLEASPDGSTAASPIREGERPEAILIGREEFEALHQEVERLPERYRIPLILCEFEGLTYEEVARRMRCPVGTVGVRLLRARERLRARLIRRGIAPVAALVEAIFGRGDASALMSWSLVEATIGGASAFVAGNSAALVGVSGSAAALTDAVLSAMALAKLKMVITPILAVALAGVGWVATSSRPKPVAVAPQIPAQVEVAPALVAAPPAEAAPPAKIIAPEPALPAPVKPARPSRGVDELAKLAGEERAKGEALFFKEWVPNDPNLARGDGLGPVFNGTSCVGCHGLGAPGGAGPEGKNVVILTRLASAGRRSPKSAGEIHPGLATVRSVVLHRYGTDPTYDAWRAKVLADSVGRATSGQAEKPKEGEVEPFAARVDRVRAETSPRGRARDRSPGPNEGHRTVELSERNTPALFGAGLIDAISSEVLIAAAKSQEGGVRGKVGRDPDGRVGRFGWKANISRLHEFVRVACAGELGLEVPGHTQSASPLAPKAGAKGLDMTEEECDQLVAYVRSLPAPVAVDPDGPQGSKEVVEGRRLFGEVDCASCHAPTLGDVRGIYSDLLLHDMGQNLGDSGESYGSRPHNPSPTPGPSPGEWRTPPLWGYRDSGPYLHDGRAETLDEAVALHGGQGTGSARRYFALTPKERFAVEAFLKSLVAPSAASAPGIVLAADFEDLFVPEEAHLAEARVRAHREQDAALETQRQKADIRERVITEAIRLAPGRLQMASNLEKAGKDAAAIDFYRQVVRDVPDTEEGRIAAARLAVLQPSPQSP